MYPDNNMSISSLDDYYVFNISMEVNIITPGLNRVLGDPYLVSVERVVPHA